MIEGGMPCHPLSNTKTKEPESFTAMKARLTGIKSVSSRVHAAACAKGRPRKETSASPVQDVPSQDSVPNDIVEVLSQKNREIVQLQAEIRRLMQEKEEILKRLQDICERFSG